MSLRQALCGALQTVRDRSGGAIVRVLDDGSPVGAVFVAAGRIHWATCAGPRELSDLIRNGATLPHERLDEAVRRSRDEDAPRLDLEDADPLRRELLRETCQGIRDLVAHEGKWEWMTHNGPSYLNALTFGPADVSYGLSVLEDSALASLARRRLAEVVQREQVGLTLHEQDSMPLAHIGCGALEFGALLDLTRQAHELMSLGRAAGARGIIAAGDDPTSAIWREGALLHVVVTTGGGMAVSRLAEQLAALTTSEVERR